MSKTTEKIIATVRATVINCLETEAYSIEYKTKMNQDDETIDLKTTKLEDVKGCRLTRKTDKKTKDSYYHLKIIVEQAE